MIKDKACSKAMIEMRTTKINLTIMMVGGMLCLTIISKYQRYLIHCHLAQLGKRHVQR